MTIRDGESAPLVTCMAGCERADIIAALRRMGLWGDREATDPAPYRPPPTPPAQYETLSTWGRTIWSESHPITVGDPAGQYFIARSCATPPADGDLRWHPALQHPNGHSGPALVGLVTDTANPARWLTLHRTWFDPTRPGQKMFVGWPCGSKPRLLLAGHRKSGGCIRLYPDASITSALGLAEGIETARSSMRTT